MGNVKWVKLDADVFNNRKIKQIETLPEGDGIIVIWFKLLCLAGNINDGGIIYFTNEIPYTEQMLATHFNRPLPLIQLALKTFEAFGMIDIVDDFIHLSNWELYQNVEGMEKIREQNRIRQKRWYDKQKEKPNAILTQPNATDKNKNREDKNKNNTIKHPSLEDIEKYIEEKGYKVNAKQFYDYYDAGGWRDKDGKPVKSWKQKVITWNGREIRPTASKPKSNFKQRDNNLDESIVDDFNNLMKDL